MRFPVRFVLLVAGLLMALSPALVVPRGADPANAWLGARSALAGSAAGRAIVLEPFADELGLGPNAGQNEVDALTRVGFQVEVYRNGDVTVPLMEKLADYSVVYIETHSGTIGEGDAIVNTGETNNKPYGTLFRDCVDDPYHVCSLQQGLAVGDSSHLYNAITSLFVKRHIDTFPDSAIVILNGCSLLAAPAFWQALKAKHVATMISWDEQVDGAVAEMAATILANHLAAGDTVAQSIQAVTAEGYGQSLTDNGKVAHLGYLGDGNNSLARALTGTPTSPEITPTSRPTARPQATSRSTATPKPRKHCKKGYKVVHGTCRKVKKRSGAHGS